MTSKMTSEAEPSYGNIEPLQVRVRRPPTQATKENTVVKTGNKRANTPKGSAQRKSKRIDGRRFKTIGYDGEVRSPLRDKKNTPIIATVQRSKSAQTPSNKSKVAKKKNEEKENDIFCQSVER